MSDASLKPTPELNEREAAFRAALEKASLTIRQLLEENANLRAKESIAVIGMSCRFPGGANSPDLYWDLLKSGRDAISEVPPSRWIAADYLSEDPSAPGRMYCSKAGFLDIEVDAFDASFFGISPKEANALDPQQRLLLELSWEAIEHAGIAPDSLKNTRTAVYVGMSGDDYSRHHRHSGNLDSIDAYSLTGSTSSTAAGRISYTLGLQGPCITLDTACSSSLVALHLATRSLRAKESDMALVGGVNLILSPEVHIAFSKLQAISPDGKCRTFDAAANGYVRSEGCAFVLLKREADALRDGDRILALIKGSATNQDGKTSGLAAPSGRAQQAVIQEALADAGLQRQEIDYVEAHGTGTSLGDPIEVEALSQTLGANRPQALKVGSAKSNIGHMEPVAGLGGLLKIILSLQHEAIPGNLHFHSPNPHIMWGEPAIEVLTALTAWPKREKPRYAGLSSFGFSGSNAHIVIAEPPLTTPELHTLASKQDPDPSAVKPFILCLSARSITSLRQLAQRYIEALENTPEHALNNFCLSALTTRTRFEHRIALAGSSAKELVQGLKAFVDGKPMPEVCITDQDLAWQHAERPKGQRRITLPLYAFDRQRYWSRSPVYESNREKSSITLTDPALAANAFITEWVEQDIAFSSEAASRTFHSARIFCIDHGLSEFADALKSMGATVSTYPSSEALLSQSDETGRPTDVMVSWPAQHTLIEQPLKLTGFCGYLVKLAQKLAISPTPPKLWLVSVGQSALATTISETAPFAFAAEGLLRSIFLEYPALRGGIMSFSSGKHTKPTIQQFRLAAETLLADQAEVATLFIDQDQHARGLVKRLKSASAEILALSDVKSNSPKRTARADATYLITGGHGALGLQAAKTLARQGAGKIVLISRTPPTEHVRQEIEGLRLTGCLIQSEAVDITHVAQLAQLLNRLSTDKMPLRGIIHAAGAIRHDALVEMSQEAMNAVMLPKALGAWYLHTLTQTLDLDCFVLYGSIAGLIGTHGLSHYTAANQFLNGLSEYRQQQGLKAVCINWGPWSVGGMVDEKSLALATSNGFSPLDPTLTQEAMSHLFFSNLAQIAVVQADWSRISHLFETRCPQPLFNMLTTKRAASTASQPQGAIAATAPSSLHVELTDILESEQPEFLAHKLQHALAVVLHFPSGQLPDRTRGFFDMGMDSISSVDFRLSLEDLVAKTLPPSIVFDYPTIDTLTTHLLTKIFTQERSSAVETQAVSKNKRSTASPTKIEELSDDELVLLIDQELDALNQTDTPR